MCIAMPMKIIKLESDMAIAELNGVSTKVSLGLINNAKLGDYILVHAGFALQIVTKEEAEKNIELLKEIDAI